MKLIVRPMQQSDRSFVVHSWVKTYGHSPFAGFVSYDRWWDVAAGLVDRILDNPLTRVRVLVDADARPGCADILSWIAFQEMAGSGAAPSKPLVHYLYTVAAYRRRGLARKLFETCNLGDEVAVTCRTTRGDILRRKLRRSHWEPKIVRDYGVDPSAKSSVRSKVAGTPVRQQRR